ncbi:MAG: BACON domain-containing protein [Paludibacteraceae bacterium]|nr:BACON domain-containing protein [Paludibacteraceae bacterium]
MKKLFFLPLLLPLVFMGCKKNAQDAEPETAKLSVEPSSITCPAFGADYTISLTAPEAWTAECADSWVKVNPTSGNAGTVEISVKISANKESKESTSKIVFKSGDQTLEVPVKRAAKDPARLLITTEKAIQTPKDGGSYTIQVESNIKWTISSNASWAKIQGDALKRDNATVNVVVDAATTPEETTALIIVAPFGEGLEAGKDTVVITRGGTDASSMTISKTEINAPADGGEYTVTVHSNIKWKVTKTWDADWLTVKNETGENNGAFAIKVDAATSGNAASTVITVEEVRTDHYKPVQLNLLVTREGKAAATLSVEPSSINAPAEGGDFQVDIKSNYPWTASLMGTKVFSVSTTSGDGDATMVVTVKPASNTDEATGTIIIKTSYGNETATVKIRRKGKEAATLEVSPTTIESGCDGSTVSITVKSNTGWIVSSSNPDVIYPNVKTGKGNGTFNITLTKAVDESDATAIITVTTDFGGLSKDINAVRKGIPAQTYQQKAFSVSSSTKVYFGRGNLLYKPYTNTWQAATQQFYIVGEGNSLISPTYSGWIDLFGWGTGSNPTLTSTNDNDYSTFTDWGVNVIWNELGSTTDWRTLSMTEWGYVSQERSNAAKLRSCATVFGVHGFILLPDDWQASSDISFTPDATTWSINTYDIQAWQKMEAKGAVFLPCNGRRDGTNVDFNTTYTPYWSKTQATDPKMAYVFSIQEGSFSHLKVAQHHYGRPVRLVRNK